ncbi:hypothetical protein IPM09_01265 [Candidatus Saccharibacteria bacterium]|nr:MAG: hypothetical protein IPM09_01265 [Candidatus Saccharibacteria bacterium]
MKTGKIIAPKEARIRYDEIIPTYQAAFAGEPWYEVSKCTGCITGFSAQEPGTNCDSCGGMTEGPAYSDQELRERFDMLAETRPTYWYVEQDEQGRMTLAALAWKATVGMIAKEKYTDIPEMADWLKKKYQLSKGIRSSTTKLSDKPSIVWIDEVFANRSISPSRNLDNFREMVGGLASRLDEYDNVAYRTIAPAMVRVALRDFDSARVSVMCEDVPDRRNFVAISLAYSGPRTTADKEK